MIDLLDNTQELTDSIETCNREVEIVNELVEKLVKENASTPQDQDEYRKNSWLHVRDETRAGNCGV